MHTHLYPYITEPHTTEQTSCTCKNRHGVLRVHFLRLTTFCGADAIDKLIRLNKGNCVFTGHRRLLCCVKLGAGRVASWQQSGIQLLAEFRWVGIDWHTDWDASQVLCWKLSVKITTSCFSLYLIWWWIFLVLLLEFLEFLLRLRTVELWGMCLDDFHVRRNVIKYNYR